MRILGLDLGEKTIGLAVSDELGMTAQGLKTIRRQGIKADLKALHAVVREYDVDCLVVGLPKNMDGSLGDAAQKVLKVVEKLKEWDIPVETEDERLTTSLAEKILIEGEVRREKRRKVIDQVAAVLILQGYLDRRGRSSR
jgi:putative Holliday junction resolvase